MIGFAPRDLTRRDMLKLSAIAAAGGLGATMSGWLQTLAAHAAQQSPGGKHKSCILLWMDGGPSHIDTFDPKPDAPAEIRGEFETIETSAPGIHVTDRLPNVAKLMHHAAVLRGMSTPDSNHASARVLMHTGYKQAAGIDYPTLGSIVSAELGDTSAVMPNFVVTGVHGYDSVKFPFVTSPGYLGTRHAPLIINNLNQGVENLRPPVDEDDVQDRLNVLEKLQANFAQRSQAPAAQSQATTLERAVQLMRSDAVKAFDLAQEPSASRDAYGDSYFGKGCLTARRLVEVGVPFVEVYLPDWDTHFKARVDKCNRQSLPQLDTAMSALIRDLVDRGLLESTLVICMGEFGRTPKINDKAGRDHYSRAWTSVLFGAGLKTGQVVGRTDASGALVEERPISVVDFMATICKALGIDYTKEYTAPGGRPLPIVNNLPTKPQPVAELFA
jgi:uncharacterized protein (DUF1501 family)